LFGVGLFGRAGVQGDDDRSAHRFRSSISVTDRALGLSRVEARVLSGALRTYPPTRRLGLSALLAAGGRNLLR
jgi:hypothetical protein